MSANNTSEQEGGYVPYRLQVEEGTYLSLRYAVRVGSKEAQTRQPALELRQKAIDCGFITGEVKVNTRIDDDWIVVDASMKVTRA